jgi:hypothetical protein
MYNIKFIGQFSEHINYIAKIAKEMKYFTIGDETGKPGDSFASMGSIMYMNDNIMASFTNSGCPIVTHNNPNIVIGSNKNNACPILIIKDANKNTLIWHIAYSDSKECKSLNELMSRLPVYFEKTIQTFSNEELTHPIEMFKNKKNKFYTTNENIYNLCNNANYDISFLELPEGLEIVSSGLESSIRSYSIGIFRNKEKESLLLSDHYSNVWMSEDFEKWLRITE